MALLTKLAEKMSVALVQSDVLEKGKSSGVWCFDRDLFSCLEK